MLQSYRVYNSQVNRLSDIVRCSVDCNSFAEILQVIKVCSQMTHILPFLSLKLSRKVMTCCCSARQVMNHWGYVPAKECSSCQANKENSHNDRKECTSCRDRKKGKIFEILRVRNRFVVDEGGNENSSGGYRDISFKIKVGFQVHILDCC